MAELTVPIEVNIDFDEIKEWLEENNEVEVVHCNDCRFWNTDTLRVVRDSMFSWEECECKIIADRGKEINGYTCDYDYCSRGVRRDGNDRD